MDLTLARPSAGFAPLFRSQADPGSRGSDASWWCESSGGSAFEAFVVENRRRVFGLLLGQVGHTDEAEDLTQEVFLKAWRARGRFRRGADPWPWLAAIATNVARDAARRRQRRPQHQAGDDENLHLVAESRASPRREAQGRQALGRVRETLARLPPRQREVLVLHAFAALSPAQIAEVLSCTANAVRVNLHHARRALRTLLDEEGSDPHA